MPMRKKHPHLASHLGNFFFDDRQFITNLFTTVVLKG